MIFPTCKLFSRHFNHLVLFLLQIRRQLWSRSFNTNSSQNRSSKRRWRLRNRLICSSFQIWQRRWKRRSWLQIRQRRCRRRSRLQIWQRRCRRWSSFQIRQWRRGRNRCTRRRLCCFLIAACTQQSFSRRLIWSSIVWSFRRLKIQIHVWRNRLSRIFNLK